MTLADTGLTWGWLLAVVHAGLQVTFIVRALLRKNREPSSRLAWVSVIAATPFVGVFAYMLFGEANIGRKRIAHLREALTRLRPYDDLSGGHPAAAVNAEWRPLFHLGQSISHYPPVGGNDIVLPASSEAAISAMVADIDAAKEHVHILFYIWLPDTSGLAVAAALIRAARRGVTCRVLVDDIGSRRLIISEHWRAMGQAGVQLARALPIGNPLLRPFKGRVDMRNHRKIVVIDNTVSYCGSQNCADAAFTVKARYAPWVDVMFRITGPVVQQNQHVFASDWMANNRGDDLSALLRNLPAGTKDGAVAQVVATSAATRFDSMPEMFVALLYAAREEVVVTTPYYVPNEAIQAALCACGHRGVAVTLIVPHRNDSWIVAAASHSYYADLLDAGVRLLEYRPGLLHAKTLTIDGQISLIGSSNMDRRSFELNFENNLLIQDAGVTATIRARQESYMADSFRVERATVAAWSAPRRVWNNIIAMLGPVL